MKRSEFLRLAAILPFGIALTPHYVIADNHEDFYSKQSLMGLSNPSLTGTNFRLLPKVALSFLEMQKEAKKDGVILYSQSSYRSYYRQKGIWERKYNAFLASGLKPGEAISKIIEYSTIPGTSRHHWGTDLDIIDLSISTPKNPLHEKHFKSGGAYEKLHLWMEENAEKYGFVLVYTNDPNRKGFKYEPWHFSFKEEAIPRLEAFLKLDIVKELSDRKLVGSEYFNDEFIERYISENIRSINPKLLP